MAVIQVFNNVENLRVDLKPSDGTSIVKIFECNPVRSLQKLGLEAKYCTVNSFIKNLSCYSEINSIPESGFPRFELEDSETQKLTKALKHSWDEARIELQLWDKHGHLAWQPIARVSIQNPGIYPYKTYNLLDLLTDSLSYEVGDNYSLGVSISDVGWGLLKTNDKLIIRGSYTQEFIVVDPVADVLKQVVINNPGAITDELIGHRVIDDELFLGRQQSGNLTVLLSSLAHQLKAIIGGFSWKDNPLVSLYDLSWLNQLTNDEKNLITNILELDNEVTQIQLLLSQLTTNAVLETEINTLFNSTWASPQLTSRWTNYATPSVAPFQYRALKDGSLEFRGGVKASSTPVENEIICTLPATLNPVYGHYIQSYTLTTLNQIYFDTSGNIRFVEGAATTGIFIIGKIGLN